MLDAESSEIEAAQTGPGSGESGGFAAFYVANYHQVVALAVVLAWRHWSRLRTPVLFWLGWILISLVPTANILDQEAPFAERYARISSLADTAVPLFGRRRPLDSARRGY